MSENSVLEQIQEKTMEWFKPFGMCTPVEIGYKIFQDHIQETEYLVIRRKDRVLFYGVDAPPITLVEEDDSVITASPVFARRGTLSEFAFMNIIESDNDNDIEELEPVQPNDGEEAGDFFERNAMWLLNPTVH